MHGRAQAPLGGPERSRWRQLLRSGAVALGVVLAAYVLWGSAGQIQEAADALSYLRVRWVVVAVVVEAASYVCLGGGLTGLLGGVPTVPVTTLVAVKAQGAANCLPAGAAVQAVVTYRELGRARCAPNRAAAAVLLLGVLQAAALPLLALAGEQVSSGVEPIPGLRGISACLLGVVAVGAGALLVLRRRGSTDGLLSALATAELRLRGAFSRRRGKAPDSGGTRRVSALAGLPQMQVSRRGLAVAAVLSVLFWLADALCLACAFPAVGAAVPWAGLLVSYAAAQLASLLPFTPGGLGVVEGSLTVGLVAYGGATTSTLGAVLLYRLISFWGLLPAAGLAWAALSRLDRQPRESR